MRTASVVLLCSGLLCACATGPSLDLSRVDTAVTPASPLSTILAERGRIVQWGGVIVGSTNLPDTTQIEVLGYPLDARGRPNTAARALRRFLVLREGYIETVDYAPGRAVTVVGSILEARQSEIGGADYLYPVIAAQQLHLWPQAEPYREPAFHFGIGVGIGL
jgi:outer membrane lipoprotein